MTDARDHTNDMPDALDLHLARGAFGLPADHRSEMAAEIALLRANEDMIYERLAEYGEDLIHAEAQITSLQFDLRSAWSAIFALAAMSIVNTATIIIMAVVW